MSMTSRDPHPAASATSATPVTPVTPVTPDGQETPGQWLLAALRRRYPSQAAFARAAGVPGQYISNWTADRVALSLDFLPAVSRALAMDAHIVAEHMGLHLPDRAPARRTPEAILAELEAQVPVSVPVVQNLTASMGAGTPAEEYVYLPPEFRRSPPHRIVAMVAAGECMEPEIRAGDYVVCDRDAAWKIGDIVIAATEGQVLVKRLVSGTGIASGLALRADATGDVIPVTEEVQVFGRIIQIIRPL